MTIDYIQGSLRPRGPCIGPRKLFKGYEQVQHGRLGPLGVRQILVRGCIRRSCLPHRIRGMVGLDEECA